MSAGRAGGGRCLAGSRGVARHLANAGSVARPDARQALQREGHRGGRAVGTGSSLWAAACTGRLCAAWRVTNRAKLVPGSERTRTSCPQARRPRGTASGALQRTGSRQQGGGAAVSGTAGGALRTTAGREGGSAGRQGVQRHSRRRCQVHTVHGHSRASAAEGAQASTCAAPQRLLHRAPPFGHHTAAPLP